MLVSQMAGQCCKGLLADDSTQMLLITLEILGSSLPREPSMRHHALQASILFHHTINEQICFQF